MKQTLEELRNNPIIKIYRDNGLSDLRTQQVINKEWKVPPEGFPMKRILSVTQDYTQVLLETVRKRAIYRRRSGITCSVRYLQEAFELTNAEINQLNIHMNLKS